MPHCTPRHAWLSLAHAAPADLELFAALRDAEPDLGRLGQRLAALFDGDDDAFSDLLEAAYAQRWPAPLGRRLRADNVQRAVDAARQRSARQADHRLLTPADAGYPERLAAIDDAPPMLTLSGDPAALLPPAIAIVGARRAGRRGLDAAEALARGLAQAGLTVVSGLAIGIDAAAHRGALAGGGRTLAVMATGADRLYPARHARLADAIVEQGALLHEFPLGQRLEKDHFPIRNRLVSGLCHGVVLIEAAPRSGTLITATHARRQNRDVMVVPGTPGDPAYQGGHELLVDGASSVDTAQQIVECVLPALQQELAAAAPEPRATVLAEPLAEPGGPYPAGSDASRTIAALDHDPVTIDRLDLSLSIGTAKLLAALTLLETTGHVERDSAGRYSRCLPLRHDASTLCASVMRRDESARAGKDRFNEGVDDGPCFELD